MQSSKIPDSCLRIFEIFANNEVRSSEVISKTWKGHNKTKLAGCSVPEIRVLHFGCKIDKMAKKVVSIIGIQYNKLYRSRAELPSVLWNQYYEPSVSYNQELSVPCVEESVIYGSSTNCIRH